MRKRDILLGVVAVTLVLGVMMTDGKMHGVKKYDCSISEISPDYPLEVKEACRKMRAERIK